MLIDVDSCLNPTKKPAAASHPSPWTRAGAVMTKTRTRAVMTKTIARTLTTTTVIALAVLGGCAQPAPEPASSEANVGAAPADVHSFARPKEVEVVHMGADWNVDFGAKIVRGTVTLKLARHDRSAPLVLDTRGLDLQSVRVGVLPPDAQGLARIEGVPWADADYHLGTAKEILGRPLEIALPETVDAVRITYAAPTDAAGLTWLEPSMTAGGNKPFLYTASQFVHGRSWYPCQDTPSVRTSFDAVITVPDGVRPVMSAEEHGRTLGGGYMFEMAQPIPSYLLALAVGDLQFAPIGSGRRTGVWAEPTTLPKAVHEFADVETMLDTAESLWGEYRWGRYDILVMPPAYAWGGMENPRLTYATPSMLAGDRSLVATIAHEISHSWSGNQVTNATWGDWWITEALTTYSERRILEKVYGEHRREMEEVIGRTDLDDALSSLPPAEQRLAVDLKGRDPDDGMTSIPFEKGYLVVKALENAVGRERLDAFLRDWFESRTFQSATTADFERFASTKLLGTGSPFTAPDLAKWIHEPGLGPKAPEPPTHAFTQVDEQVSAYDAGTPPASLETSGWTTHEWLRFLGELDAELGAERIAALDDAFELTQSGNAVIFTTWIQMAIKQGYRESDEAMRAYLMTTGRRKLVLPIYKALKESNRLDEARAIYAEARPRYAFITQRSIDELLGAP